MGGIKDISKQISEEVFSPSDAAQRESLGFRDEDRNNSHAVQQDLADSFTFEKIEHTHFELPTESFYSLGRHLRNDSAVTSPEKKTAAKTSTPLTPPANQEVLSASVTEPELDVMEETEIIEGQGPQVEEERAEPKDAEHPRRIAFFSIIIFWVVLTIFWKTKYDMVSREAKDWEKRYRAEVSVRETEIHKRELAEGKLNDALQIIGRTEELLKLLEKQSRGGLPPGDPLQDLQRAMDWLYPKKGNGRRQGNPIESLAAGIEAVVEGSKQAFGNAQPVVENMVHAIQNSQSMIKGIFEDVSRHVSGIVDALANESMK